MAIPSVLFEVCPGVGWVLRTGEVLNLFAGSNRCSTVGVRTTVGLNRLGVARVQTWMVGVLLAHIKKCHLWCAWRCLVSWRFRQFVSMVSRHYEQRRTNAGKITEWMTCMGGADRCPSCGVNLVRYPGHSDRTASPGRYTNTGQRATVPRARRDGFCCSVQMHR